MAPGCSWRTESSWAPSATAEVGPMVYDITNISSSLLYTDLGDFLFDDILFLYHHCKSAYDDSMNGMVYTVYIYIDV